LRSVGEEEAAGQRLSSGGVAHDAQAGRRDTWARDVNIKTVRQL
jgi:hypothetical protein